MTCCPPEVAAGDPWLPLPPPPGPCWPLAPAALASVTATSLKGLVGLLESNATVQENGRPKLELVPNSGVYVTHLQLDNVSQVSTDKPKLMTQRLLDYFWWETLARSSATGQHIAHNATMERPLRLPMAMVNAIKEHGTKLCGHGCNFNAVINSKCGRSWWAVRKVVME